MTKTCPHAAAGCNFPDSECSGHCLIENGLRKRQDPPGYLTIVYRITHPKQPRALLEQAEWSAASHTHAIHERDQLLARLDATNKAANELAVALEKARRECNHWHARLLAEVNNRNTKEKT